MIILKSFIAAAMLLVVTSACAAGQAAGNGQDKEYGNVPEGTLILPKQHQANGRGDATQRKCMKVCKEWGETCIIDPRTGARKCRRTCKEFGMECF